MCLIATAGIGAVSASDEPVCTVTLFQDHDGTATVLGIFESSGPLNVTVTQNEDGSTNTYKNGIRIPEEELCFGLGIDNCPYVYPEEVIPELVNMIGEGIITADTLKPPEKTDAPARTLFYKPAPISASNEPVGVVTVGKISPDGNVTVVGTFESSEPIDVKLVTKDEYGSVNITRNGIPVPEEGLCCNPGILYTRPAPVIASDDDEPAVSATVGKINSDRTTTPIKTLEGSGPIYLTVTRNEDGSMNVTKNGRYSAVVNHRMSRQAFTDPDKVNRYPQAKVWYQRVTPLTGTVITKMNEKRA